MTRLGAWLVVGLLAQRVVPGLARPPAPASSEVVATAAATAVATHTSAPPPPRVPPGRRGRWGLAIGIARFDADATYDYRNSATPLAGASGPYSGAAIPLRYRWISPYLSVGYRGAVAGSKVGFGLEAEGALFGWSRARSPSTTGTSPAGVPVTFTIEGGGIQTATTAAVSAHVSYLVLPRLNLIAGGKESYLLTGASWGLYRGPAQTSAAFFGAGHIPRFVLEAFVPWLGVEYFLGNHRSLQMTVEFPPTTTEHLATTPWDLTFNRRRTSLAVAIRFFR